MLPFEDGSVLVAIGDVMGRGIAAATVMGQIRAALRAYVLLDPSPEVVLSRLDTLVASLGVPEQFVTVLVGLIAPDRSGVRLASAGHVPPVCAREGEPAALVPAESGPPLAWRATTGWAAGCRCVRARSWCFAPMDWCSHRGSRPRTGSLAVPRA